MTTQTHPHPTPPEAVRLLRETAVSKRYNLTLPFLRNARWRGDGPPFCKINSMVYYRPEDVDAWIQSNMVASTTEAAHRKRM